MTRAAVVPSTAPRLPTAAIRSPRTPTSAGRPGAPVPSTRRPLRTRRSNVAIDAEWCQTPTLRRRLRGSKRRGPLLYSPLRRGAIAQLGERLNGIQKVRGSNPLSSTKDLAPMASRSSASELGERVATRLGGCPLNPLPESAGGGFVVGREK